jgi:4-methyl-5(b-hydroxyethyl)-thiazole monophosphate biosynthesis
MVYIFLADGFEEIEALAVADILRRTGIEVKLVGLEHEMIKGAHGITVKSDILGSDISKNKLENKLECIVLPGGIEGTKNLGLSSIVEETIRFCFDNNLLVAAICAAPTILGKLGFLQGKDAVCYPGLESELKGANLKDSAVCEDGNLITSKGPGTALEFGLAIVKYLKGESYSKEIRSQLQCI